MTFQSHYPMDIRFKGKAKPDSISGGEQEQLKGVTINK